MPIGCLTAADRTRLNCFPEQIPDEDLRAFFLLSEADHGAITSPARPIRAWALPSNSVRCGMEGSRPMISRRRQRRRSSIWRSHWEWPPLPALPTAHVDPRGPPTSNRCKPTCTSAWPPRWISMPYKRGEVSAP